MLRLRRKELSTRVRARFRLHKVLAQASPLILATPLSHHNRQPHTVLPSLRMITYRSAQADFETNTVQTCNGQSTNGKLDRMLVVHSNDKLHPCLFLHGQAVMPRVSGRILSAAISCRQISFVRTLVLILLSSRVHSAHLSSMEQRDFASMAFGPVAEGSHKYATLPRHGSTRDASFSTFRVPRRE